MAWTNTGNQRSLTVTITKWQNNNPIYYSYDGLTHIGFLTYSGLTSWSFDDMQKASLSAYNARLAALNAYVETQHPEIDMDTITIGIPAYRMNVNACPLPETPVTLSYGVVYYTDTIIPEETDMYRTVSIGGLFGSREITPKFNVNFQSNGDMQAFFDYRINGGTWIQTNDWYLSTPTPVEVTLPVAVTAGQGLAIRLRLARGNTNPQGGTLSATLAGANTVPAGLTVTVDPNTTVNTFTIDHIVS